ncbi:MAG: glycosyltransferase family 39 protein [Gemmataceae bacterium]|nr:glycosyltransferase family 39 protein [Gemmataceae bacterium]
MDEPRSESILPVSQRRLWRDWRVWRDWQWLLLLVCLVVPLRAWLLYNTEVMARDSVGYIRYALRFEEKSYGEVLRSFDQHPGYPIAIWLTSLPLRAWAGTTPDVMQWSAQLASSLAAVLLLVPMFYLGKALWDARVGFGAALLFQFLPMSGHHLSDGMSESLFVLLVAAALLCGIWALQTRRLFWFAACGAGSGLAYLTRPEGAVVLAAVGLTLAAFQIRVSWREPWTRWIAECACLIVPALLVGSLYVMATGCLTNKPSIQRMAEFAAASFGPAGNHPHLPGLWAQLWADSFVDITSPLARLVLGARALITEVGYALHYLGCIPLAVAVFWKRRALCADRAAWAMAGYVGLHAAALLMLARSAGYLSDRHLMPIVMLLCFPTMIGILELGRWIAAWQTRGTTGPGVQRNESWHSASWAAMALLALLVIACLPKTGQRLHGNRAGNRAAGLWLAERLHDGDLVLDDHDWTRYYSGQMLLEGKEPPAAADYQPKCYVVITRTNDPKVKKIRDQLERRLKWSQGEIVYHWPAAKPAAEARIVMYSLPRDPRTYPWKVAAK